jgi:uncharacterized membrane-anchored protein YitT (DUF2179 family)
MKKAWSYSQIVLTAILLAFVYYIFIVTNNFAPAGLNGIATMIQYKTGFSISYMSLLINIPLSILAYFLVQKDFAVKTLLFSLVYSVSFLFLQHSDLSFIQYNALGHDTIYPVILSGVLAGSVYGVCFRNNASTGGMDILQKMVVKFFHFPFSKTVYVTDGIIIMISLFVFGIEQTMYSLFSIYLIGLFIDLVCMGGTSRRTAFIISEKNEEIKKVIIEKLGRGVTVVPASGGYSAKQYDMLVSTLSKNESYLLKDIILEIDTNAFTFFVSAKEVYGDGFE